MWYDEHKRDALGGLDGCGNGHDCMDEIYHASEDCDIDLYDAFANECREVFIERRFEHGSHTNKPIFYSKVGFAEKCYRAFEDVENDNPIRRDTLIDLINYAIMVATTEQ